jgi:hypothetical protein
VKVNWEKKKKIRNCNLLKEMAELLVDIWAD